ncbi:hypothetical protein [Streptomyces sp. NPDC057199]|uniref:hypothetical protein n=1 Tax=Streptomyces sp. NPDC057199 TaxID=3346047 RepID=UPI00363C9F60
MTAAAQYTGRQLRYLVVPATADTSRTSIAATGAPGTVAHPARAGWASRRTA